MATNNNDMRTVELHNLNELEIIKNDLSKEILKLRLVYEYIGNKGFTSEADSLLGESISFAEQYNDEINLFFDCISNGSEFNPDKVAV